ncbi:hypothetical protein ALO91_200041 [Pseudomonas syringae pv. aceris]|uniref:Amino acid permease-associated region n=2 Tax=Pseudomonas TaxID=286 RepID=A0A0P9GTS8_PSESX|nr:hypothetical protein ALO91_200041 [Pseudomonas syringae pv. aceris]
MNRRKGLKMGKAVSFKVTPAEAASITTIVDRVTAKLPETFPDRESLEMDITACHANGCKLRLADMAEADDFNLVHDVGGIRQNIDRATGKLRGHFLPRFSA